MTLQPPAVRALRRLCGVAAGLLASASASAVAAAPAPHEGVRCRVDYGGETRVINVRPVADAYAEAPVEVGQFFLLRIVLQTAPADTASLRVSTYANLDAGPLILQQQRFTWPPPQPSPRTVRAEARGVERGGFTGLLSVYEPLRDSEMQYWCERLPVPTLKPTAKRGQP